MDDRQIERFMERLERILKSQAGHQADLDKVFKNLENNLKNTKDDFRDLSSAIGKVDDDLSRSMINRVKFEKEMEKREKIYAEYRDRRFGNSVANMFTDAGGYLSTKLSDLASSMFGPAVVGAFVGAIVQSTQTFGKLIDIGQTFGGSIYQMNIEAANAGMSLEVYAKAVRDNAVLVSQLGTAGFSTLSRQVVNVSKKFGMFGLSADELMERFGEYSESLLANDARLSKDTNLMANGFANLMNQTVNVAGAFGKSSKEIFKTVLEIKKASTSLIALTTIYGDKAPQVSQSFDTFASMFAGLGDEGNNIVKGAFNTLAMGSSIFDDNIGTLGAYLPGFVRNIDQIQKLAQAGDQEGIAQATHTAIMGLKQLSTSQVKHFRFLAEAGDTTASSILKLHGEALKYNKTLAEATQEMRLSNLSKEALNFRTNVMQLSSIVRDVFLVGFKSAFTDFDKSFGQLIKDLGDENSPIRLFIQGFGKALGEVTNVIVTTVSGFATLGNKIGELVDDKHLGGLLSALGATVTMFATFFGVKKGIGLIGALLGRNDPKVNLPGGASRAGSVAGGALGKLGGGVIGGIMQGAATGVKAFSNPQMLIGVGVISALGLAIAGMIKLAGPELDNLGKFFNSSMMTMTEGLERLSKLDGMGLLQIVPGLVALGPAFAAFGIGSTVAGISTLVGSGSVFDNIIKLSQVNPDGLKNVAVGINEIASALSNYGKSSITGAIGVGLSKLTGLTDVFSSNEKTTTARKANAMGELSNSMSSLTERITRLEEVMVSVRDFQSESVIHLKEIKDNTKNQVKATRDLNLNP